MLENEHYEDRDFSGLEVDLPELSRKKFIRCNFSNADFSELSMVYSCAFDNCRFSSARLGGVTFRGCSFLNCRFSHASFFATVFEDCKMTGSSFIHTDCSLLTISGGDWSYTELRMLEFTNRTFTGVNFFGADLSGTRFHKCRMDDCNFREAVADGLSLRDSDVRRSDLGGIDILSVDMKNTRVDIQQCVVLAEALGARYTPED